jgi:hypothetical protein
MQNKTAYRLFQGKSGRAYTYGYIDPNAVLPFGAGNYIVAKDKGNDIDIIYVGEANSIYGEFINTMLWTNAKAAYGADLIFGHPHLDPAARDSEKRDLVDQWNPPMNLP